MPDEGKILFIGNTQEAFSSAIPGNPPIETCPQLNEGIEKAGKQNFSTIAIVMGDNPVNLKNNLALLRENTDARILLLARMFEEPAARELVGTNGSRLADDYIIYPARSNKLLQLIYPEKVTVSTDMVLPSVTELKNKIRHLEILATEDELTGLKNRRYILEFARQIIERAHRDNGRVTILIFDIDNFKHYNDVYGHAAGDEVLKQTSTVIQRCCRKHDAVGRLGGDEFAVVFWDDAKTFPPAAGDERRTFSSDHPQEAILIARRFRSELGKAEFKLLGSEGRGMLTISGGLASLRRDGLTSQELFAKADYALLDAKRSGKNRVYLVGQPQNDIDKIE